MTKFIFLGIAIVLEAFATSMLNKTEQFTKLLPTVCSLAGYGFAFWVLSFALRDIPVGIAYAIWSGVGIVLVTIIGALVFKQVPDIPAIIGLVLIIIGVVVINVFSHTTSH